jgi:hypothetical protein
MLCDNIELNLNRERLREIKALFPANDLLPFFNGVAKLHGHEHRGGLLPEPLVGTF